MKWKKFKIRNKQVEIRNNIVEERKSQRKKGDN